MRIEPTNLPVLFFILYPDSLAVMIDHMLGFKCDPKTDAVNSHDILNPNKHTYLSDVIEESRKLLLLDCILEELIPHLVGTARSLCCFSLEKKECHHFQFGLHTA